jgi:hypothetical protein
MTINYHMRWIGERSSCWWGESLVNLQIKRGTENGSAWAKGSWMWLQKRYGVSSSLVRSPSDPYCIVLDHDPLHCKFLG